MRALNRYSCLPAAALVVISNFALAEQPPNVVDSDSASNTAMGTDALLSLTAGSGNTASGSSALFSNTVGNQNTATGQAALFNNTTGDYNTATGSAALFFNETGERNTASGVGALQFNATGGSNTASGVDALYSNTTGGYNTASGVEALKNNTSGSHNAALGYHALYRNRTGIKNIAVGNNALLNNTTGRFNTAIGWGAGQRVTTGSDNIVVANPGVTGESQTMRLGKQGSAGTIGSGVTRTFIAGINGVTTGLAGSAVLVDANGQLGTISSSRRYKQDIQSMGSISERLMALRPVTFRYKEPDASGSKPLQFGLVAEEVAEVFPELVIYDEAGKPETVSYHLLATLLLNEFQKERNVAESQASRIAGLEYQTAELMQLKREFARMAAIIERLDHARMVVNTQ